MKQPEILVLSWIPPSFTNGGGIRTYYLLRELGRSFRIVFAYPELGDRSEPALPDKAIEVVRLSGALRGEGKSSLLAKLIGLEPPFATRYCLRDGAMEIDQFLRKRKVSGIQMFQAHMMLNMPKRAFELPVHLDLFDVLTSMARREMKQSRSLHDWAITALRYRNTARWEKRALRAASFISVVSEKDMAAVHRWIPGAKCAVVSNGADVIRFQPPSDAELPRRAPCSVIFVGSLGYRPNYDGVMIFIRTVLPLVRLRHPDATFTIAGSGVPSDLRRMAEEQRVVVVDSPADIRPYLHQSMVSIVPILNGGGTRIKILEASAAGTAVVATPVGAEGIRMRDGEHLLIREMPEAFASAIGDLFDHPEECSRMADSAGRLVQKEYDWSVVSRPFQEAWNGTLQGNPAQS